MEENLRRALIISRGELTTFLERPISAGLLLVAAVLLIARAAAHDPQGPRRGLRGVTCLPESSQAPSTRTLQ